MKSPDPRPGWSHHGQRSLILVISVVTILFAIHLAIGLGGWKLQIAADGREYLQLANNLLKTGSFTYDGINPVVGKPPGFPAVIAIYLWLVGSLKGFQVLQLVFMFLAFLTTGVLASRLIGTTRSLVLIALLVATPPLYLLTGNLWSEPLFLLLTVLGLYAFYRMLVSKSWGQAVLAGLAFGASTYVRPINLFFPIASFLISFVAKRPRRKLVFLFMLVHTLSISPWIVRNWVDYGKIIPMVANWAPLYYITNQNLWETYFYQGSGVIRQSEQHRKLLDGQFQFNWKPNARFKEKALKNILADPGGYFFRCLRQAFFVWTYLPGTKEAAREAPTWFFLGRIVMFLFYIVTLLGTVQALRRSALLVFLLWGYAIYTGIILFPVCTESRYLIPAYLGLSPLSMMGAARLLNTPIAGKVLKMVRKSHE